MKTVQISLNSIDKVKSFVNDITKFDYDFDLVSGRYVIDAKSIMGIFSLDLSKPIDLNIHAEDNAEEVLPPDFLPGQDGREDNGEEEETRARYKSSRIKKEMLEKILWEEGYIEIKDKEGRVIGRIDKGSKEEEGYYKYEYEEEVQEIEMEISKAKEEGRIEIENEKIIKEYIQKHKFVRKWKR